ncbi:hypothetical protein J5N97_020315 [Dioscorea zingiberensis]|uniref:AP2/ERF domain-containing protein n=1 Tax=Dioscorea zingiberensis TaxID=325984 RepID=A0A9D5CFN0_9LILI|nr:hypothetical protein J5N97_020315 [Dioscorea zingiberensis]
MGSMNNWLAFSLSHHDLPPAQTHETDPSSTAVSGLISSDCFALSVDSPSSPPRVNAIPSLRPDHASSFPFLESFTRTHHQTNDWGMKSLAGFKGSSSELSMVVGSSSNNIQNNMEDGEPKLEDFLGGHSFTDHDDQKLSSVVYDAGVNEYTFSNCSLRHQLQPSDLPSNINGANGGLVLCGSDHGGTNNSSIGLSMIKTWLRNQPAPAPVPQPGNTGSACGGAMVASSQSLSLSMSTGSQSVAAGGECSSSSENKQKTTSINGGAVVDAQSGAIEAAVPRKSIDTFGQRTSIYRGVTRHRWTGRYEAHLWDNSCRREGQTRKGRQGGYDKEEKAARAYDLAALKYWGTTTTTNFPISNYEKELEEMKNMTRQEYVASLRRKSSGFSRGASIYRGVTRHHQHGRWQARIGRVAGNKDLYLGTFSTQEEAAEAYDIAAIKFRGLNAVTNFDMSRYDVKSIMESNTLPIGGAAKRLKEVSEHGEASIDGRRIEDVTSQLTGGMNSYGSHYHHHGWPSIAFQSTQPMSVYNPSYVHQRGWCKQEQPAVITHSLHDLHQLHLGSNTHNFFQPPAATLHGFVNGDSPSMEHSTGSNTVYYGGGNGSYNGLVMPVSTVVVDQNPSSFTEDEVKPLGYESLLAIADPYNASRNVYGYEQSSGSNNTWMQASAQPGNASRANTNIGGSIFSVWNDT